MDRKYSISKFARRIGRSASTVRRWEREGVIGSKRLPSGHRFFNEDDVRSVLGKSNEKRLVVVYCRVSSHTQKDGLQSQIAAMEQYCLGAGIATEATTHNRLSGGALHIVDKAAVVASEDLTAPIASKHQWRRFNRRMSSWAKGALARALDSICTQRKARHVLVNGAYTLQMDSTNGLLEGKRAHDKFYRESGDVLQADHNAALNVLARLDESEITRFTPYREVRQILLLRSPAQLSVKGLELGEESPQPSADKSYAQVCATF